MKSILSYALLLISLASCTIRFDRVPKNTLTEFPPETRGKYLFTHRQESDSTYVTITSKTIVFTDNKILRGGGLSDTIKLAKGEKYYYLCQGDSLKNRFVWDVYPMRISGRKMFLFALDANEYKKSIKKYFIPDEEIRSKNEDSTYNSEIIYKMNEEKLDRFCSKKLRNRNALRLIRVQ